MESSNVVINDEVCSEAQSENIAPVQDKSVENDDSLPIDYVGKHKIGRASCRERVSPYV